MAFEVFSGFGIVKGRVREEVKPKAIYFRK